MGFFKSLVKKLIDEGNKVDIATNEQTSSVPDCYREWGCKVFQISTSRSPFSFGNIKAIKQIRKIAVDYDIVHCHTPLAGLATRLACKPLRKKTGLKVFYTAHGFHFFKGAPKKNWLLYYPIEKICSKWTDTLITINKEDYELAKKKMKAQKVIYVSGVGVDINRFSKNAFAQTDMDTAKEELALKKDDIVLLSVGELSERKNHKIVIQAISKLGNPNIQYYIVGKGGLESSLRALITNKNLDKQVHLLGFREDIPLLLSISDLFVFPSRQEGLPVALMEAISSKTPVVCSDIRGNVELVCENQLFDCDDVDGLVNRIKSFIENGYKKETEINYCNIHAFSIEKVIDVMLKIYSDN